MLLGLLQSHCCQLLNHIQLFETPWTAAHQAPVSSTISRSLHKLTSIESVVLSNHLILSCSILLPLISPSIRVFSSKSALHIRWPKYWSFSFSISSSNEYSGLTSFRIDWFDLLAIQGTLKSLLQHNLKVSIICPQNHAKYLYTIKVSLALPNLPYPQSLSLSPQSWGTGNTLSYLVLFIYLCQISYNTHS